MIVVKQVLVTAVAVLPFTVQATRLFYNSGTKSGWDYTTPEHKGTVDQVTNIVYEGPTAIKVTQTYDPNYSGDTIPKSAIRKVSSSRTLPSPSGPSSTPSFTSKPCPGDPRQIFVDSCALQISVLLTFVYLLRL